MKILLTIPSMGLNAGGPTLSTFLTVKGLREHGVQAEILTYDIANRSDKLISADPFIHTLPPATNAFAYSKQYKKYLLANKYDLYHAQGIWLYPTFITAKIARKLHEPYIITPRGMLYPQDLAKGRFKKQVFLKLFLKNDLQKAACVHATCMEEMQHIRNLGITSPIAVIPNPIDTNHISKSIATSNKLRMGYLGRVHPRKNIERLLYAWQSLGDEVKDKELLIIGDGDRSYMHFLQTEAKRLSLHNVVFTGFLSGEEKEKALASLSYLAVPSDFENFGMIIPEALMFGIPVIASTGTPWQELEKHRCGWWVKNDVETFTKSIETALHIAESERQAMGQRGRKLIEENYSVEIVAAKMKQLYEWILNGKEKPEFVYEPK